MRLPTSNPTPSAPQGSGVFPTYPVLRSMRWQAGIAQVVGTGMPRRSWSGSGSALLRSRPLRTVRAGRSPHTAQASREGVAG
jgi:hypothetical protein